MRKKIDRLIPFNLLWLFLIIAYVWTNNSKVLYGAAAGTVVSIFYSLVLLTKTVKHVEQSSRRRVQTRIYYSILLSLTIAGLSVSLYLHIQ